MNISEEFWTDEITPLAVPQRMVYLAHYNNGEEYEDYNEWNSEVIHLTREACVNEIEKHGYEWFEEKYPNGYINSGYRLDGEDRDRGSAEIVELPLIE